MSFHVDLGAFDEIEKMLLRNADNADKYAAEMITAGAEVLVAAQKAELSRMAKTDRSVGNLANSIGMGRIKRAARSPAIGTDVFPQGNQPHGHPRAGRRGLVSNAQVGFVMEYGRSNMPARPWISKANAKAADAVNEAMAQVWERVSEGEF